MLEAALPAEKPGLLMSRCVFPTPSPPSHLLHPQSHITNQGSCSLVHIWTDAELYSCCAEQPEGTWIMRSTGPGAVSSAAGCSEPSRVDKL